MLRVLFKFNRRQIIWEIDSLVKIFIVAIPFMYNDLGELK